MQKLRKKIENQSPVKVENVQEFRISQIGFSPKMEKQPTHIPIK